MKCISMVICTFTLATSCQMHKPADSEITFSSVEKNISLEDGVYQAGDFGVVSSTEWSVTKKTLRGGMQEGVEILTVDNLSLIHI